MYDKVFPFIAVAFLVVAIWILDVISRRFVDTYRVTDTEVQVRFLRRWVVKRIPIREIGEVKLASRQDIKRFPFWDQWGTSWLTSVVLIERHRNGASRWILVTPENAQGFIADVMKAKTASVR